MSSNKFKKTIDGDNNPPVAKAHATLIRHPLATESTVQNLSHWIPNPRSKPACDQIKVTGLVNSLAFLSP